MVTTIIVVTTCSPGIQYAARALHNDNTYEVSIWNKDGLAVQDSFLVYHLQ